MRRILLAAFLCALAGIAKADLYAGDTRITGLRVDNVAICSIYADGVAIYEAGTPPTITTFSANRHRFLSTDLPATLTLSWLVSDFTTGTIRREPESVPIAAFNTDTGVQNTPVFLSCGSVGCRYVLRLTKTASGCSQYAIADLIVRVVTAPTLTALTATPPVGGQIGPTGGVEQCSTVTWTATAGDPAATWAFSQTGDHIAHLPSSRRSTPASSPQRVCRSTLSGGSTTLTLSGTNEAGSVSRQVTITWQGAGR